MEIQAPSYLFKETRINLDSALPNSTVLVRLPLPGAFSRLVRTSHKRPLITEVPPAEDENAFKTKHLASAASIYHRQHHTSPRSFLWRVLEDGKALSITAADLCKQENGPENPLTLRFSFNSPIRPGCIALADSKDHDTLSVFALTESNHLYTLTLRPDFFRRRTSTEDNVEDWCKTYLSSAFSFKHPHRIIAPRPGELLISLHDGGLLKLNRQPGEDASAWKETFYNEGGWTQGLRSLIPFHGSNTIKHGKISIELAAGTSIAASEVEIDGDNYAFTVSLDHRIRVWNLDTGKIAYTGDLLGVERQPNDLGKWIIHPSQSQLIRVIQDSDERTVIVTLSPVGAGEFKFWTLVSNGDDTAELVDMFPEIALKPPSPTTDVWTIADFSTALHSDERGKLSLWILWKNNITYRVQSVDITLLSAASTKSSWKLSWTAVATETLAETPLPVIMPLDPADATEQWLSYIFYPGKYTTATIETALCIYERSLGNSQKTSVRTTKNLLERVSSIIGSTATLTCSSNGQIDYEHFNAATDAQWRRFYRLIVELDKQRGEALSLSFDFKNRLPTVAIADGLSVIRDCSAIERLWHNPDNAFGGQADAVSGLVSAAAAFRENFTDVLQHACRTQLRVELYQDPSLTNSERLQLFYDKCNFAGQIGDEDFNQLLANLGGNFKDLSLGLYEALLGAMAATEDFDSLLERHPMASLGRKIVVKGVQEIVELHHSICLDQLVLLAFIEGEVDQDEEGMRLDTAIVHKQLMTVLKRLEVLEWLSRTQISIPPLKTERPDNPGKINDSPSKKREDLKTVTVLEGTLNHLLGLATHSDLSTSSLLTELLIRVCVPNSDIEIQPALIQAFLLKTDHADLAVSFSRFCSQDPFSIYVQGRACLAMKDFSTASTHFKKVAFGLAHPEPHTSDRHSSGLLNDTEWNSLRDGIPSYYAHIASLFDSAKSHSQVIDFARLALQFLPAHSKSSATPKAKKDAALRADLLSRLFSSALYTARYDLAHSILHLIPDVAIQKSNLRNLVYALCENSAASELLELPFLGAQDMVDEVLGQKCIAVVDINVGVPWHKILYAWRIRRGDFRGAAAVAYERLQKLQQLGNGGHGKSIALRNGKQSSAFGGDELDTPVTRQYLQLINALSCVEPEQAWILAEPVGRKNGVLEKRRVITLEDTRRGLQEEMDRVEGLLRGRFSFVDVEAGDVDMDEA